MSKKSLIIGILYFVVLSCGEEKNRDMQKPEIQISFPQNCIQLRRGESFTFRAQFSDNAELGSYNIEIHNNFDRHSHSTSNAECELDDKKTPVNAWVFNQSYEIPAGLKTFEASNEITVPADIDAGDYHFMVRLTDRSGWQQLAAASVKIY
ncbi:MAG: DUF4625 domain-containing protein [Prevotellaceae bacterium]|jgi:hypothetical protein|nr:DUF4625 domain-containing protein [Prevotellaceae bacterium]